VLEPPLRALHSILYSLWI